jgi:serine/threonine-protein phosphatase 2A regulatory subunit A
MDETMVREAAVPALASIGDSMDASDINESFHPLVRGLVNDAWWTCKVSAAGLFASSYPKAVPESQAELKAMFGQLTKDETPMVRRSLAANFGKFVAAVEPAGFAEIASHFTKLSNDDQDSVRILMLHSCVSACKTQSAEACQQSFYPAIENFAKDASWRVRLEVAKCLADLTVCAEGLSLIPMMTSFLQDVEIDVRRFALDQLPLVLAKSPEVAESSGILDAIKEMVVVDMEMPNALLLKTSLAKQVVIMAPSASALHSFRALWSEQGRQ